MTRPVTCICVLLAGASGLYLYQSKHQAQMLDREIAHTLKATDVARDRIGVLRGEWAMLNEPERLAALSQAHLELKTLTPSQFATAAELGALLPPPVPPGTVTMLAEDAALPPTMEPVPQPAPTAPVAAPAPPVPVRTSVVTARQPPVMQNQLAVALPPTPPHSAARTSEARTSEARMSEARTTERHEDPTPPRPPMQVASALPMPMAPLPIPRPATLHPVLAPVVNVSVSPMAAPPPPRPVQTRPAPAHAATLASSAAAPPRSAPPAPENPAMSAASAPPSYVRPPYSSTSALGGSRPQLPPPVPFGSAMAASSTNAR